MCKVPNSNKIKLFFTGTSNKFMDSAQKKKYV